MKFAHWAFLICITLSGYAAAQETGQITGAVRDSSQAAIVNAQVTVSSPERGITRDTKTNNDGEYLFGALPPGSYNLTIRAPGFKNYVASGIVLRIAQKARADATLQVGAQSTEVTVEGSQVGQVETQSSEVSGVITGKQISQLELNGRNFSQLTTLTAGVSNQSGQDEGTVGINGNVAFSFNGGRTEYNNWELDGGDNMDNGSNTSLNVYPSIDAIAEVKVLTSNYGAQYGRNGSGTVEVETKSGTSQFHGDVYEFVRNEAFNARNYFESSVPPYHKNDFGYTIGGPIFIPGHYNTNKQKTFFFWSQEWRKESVPGQVFNVSVPSAAERTGNFTDLCSNPGGIAANPDCPHVPGTNNPFPNNIVPVTTVGQGLLPLIPIANAGIPGAALYNASPTQPTDWREELFRIDQNFGSKVRVMFRYAHDSWNTVTPTTIYTGSSFPTVQTNFVGPAVGMVARVLWNPSSTLVNEFVASYTTDHISFTSTGYPDPNAWKLPANFPMGYFFNNGAGGKLPAINLSGNAAYGTFYEDPNGEWPEGPYNSNPTYTYRDNVTKIIGRHNLQFGGYFVAAQKNELSAQLVNGSLVFAPTSSNSTGNSFADLLMGNVAQFTQASTNIKFYNRYKILEPYFQDDWRTTAKLTLSLGLRISMFGTYREKYNHAYNWTPGAYNPANAPQIDVSGAVTGFPGALIPGTGNPFDGLVQCGVHGVPAGCMTGHLFNPAPRVGFAWDPTGKGTTAIRGGYGIFFEHTNGNEANTEGMEGQSSPLIQTVSQYNVAGYGNLGNGGGTTQVLFPLAFYSIPTHAVWPYMQQWHLDIQQQAYKDTIVTLAYVGSKGTHLGRQYDSNQIYPVPLSQDPFQPGQPITSDICNAAGNSLPAFTQSGVPIVGQAYNNLQVACGLSPDPFRPYYGIGAVTRLDNGASSTYNAFQASARRTVGALQFSVAYTWSHSIDDASSRYDVGALNAYDLSANRASSSFDIRNMLNISYVYDLPFFKTPGKLHALLGGWQFSGITTFLTGTPFSAVNGGAYADNAGSGNPSSITAGSYVDVTGVNPYYNIPHVPFGAGGLGPLIANPAAFVAPQGLTFGNAGRNSLRNPGFNNWNMALFKHFAVKESAAFEFRAEAFNIFNHTEWGPVGGDAGSAAYNGFSSNTNAANCFGGPSNSAGDPSCLGNSTFLYIGIAHPARILQLGAKFIF
jgi:hypothetical protein